MVISFTAGFVLILIGSVIALMGLGVYSDMNNFGSFSWRPLGLTVFRYEAMAEGGHLLHFGLGLLLIALLGGFVNSSLSAVLHKAFSEGTGR